MAEVYNHKVVEKKWQKVWDDPPDNDKGLSDGQWSVPTIMPLPI